ncbi:hypothetical protein [Cupriavidus sp. SS-3]|uniref:hypothetical protein n=1 Tax=Cupriavidus sp. SS-3 TaxID=3109596 RepID=UPI002DB8D4F1|nr:hypothetical protein [Cupriavidus sp. SS-3]MEC3766363.1 hypothetical protein [Cupriavidus sp. SS-3]
MNKILIVGHPTSRYSDVESLLNACGMKSAMPSRREGLSPAEIGAVLLKAHSVPLLTQFDQAKNPQQIDPGPIWHGMALDLMLGNIDQPLWGWSDPHAAYLLDYWSALDPNIAFILVYGSPHSLLTDAPDVARDLSPDLLTKLIGGWCAYNRELLHFYHRNMDRALLVHAQQVKLSSVRYVQQVRSRIGAQLHLPLDIEANNVECDQIQSVKLTQPVSKACKESPEQVDSSSLKEYIADFLIKSSPQAAEIYEELQAVAALPLLAVSEPSALDAWRIATQQECEREEYQRKIQILVSAEETTVAMRSRLDSMCQELATQTRNAELTAGKLQEAEARLAMLQGADRDNQVLLSQVHVLQEELEDRHLEGNCLNTQIKELRDRLGAQGQIEERNTRLLLQLQQLQKELQSRELECDKYLKQIESLAMSEKVASGRAQKAELRAEEQQELAEENCLLLAQLHHVQQELERHHLEARSQILRASTKLPTAEPETAKYYGAAERVKKQLTYRLGATIIGHSRSLSGWLSMPWALSRETRQFRAERRAEARKEKLPPIAKYCDAFEAERVKRHLSYRLGEKLLANVNTPIGWLKLPYLLRREVVAFRLEKNDQ